MSAIDRLAELRAVSGVKDTGDDDTSQQPSAETSAELSESLAKYDAIKKGLDTIKANVQEVERLKAKNKTTANEKSRKEIMSQLDKVMSETNQQGTFIKRTLDEIKKDNDRAAAKDKDSAKAQMRRNLYQTHIRRFHQVMNDYNSAAHAFKQDLQKRTRREIKIVDDTISDAEIEKIVESGQANDVIKKALISDNLQDVVRVIEERHLDIMKLEQQVLEVYELFRDLATLVDLQKESLDVIENRIVHAKDYTEKAEVELGEAEDYQKKARNRRCCLLFILLGVLIAILAPSILKALDKI